MEDGAKSNSRREVSCVTLIWWPGNNVSVFWLCSLETIITDLLIEINHSLAKSIFKVGDQVFLFLLIC